MSEQVQKPLPPLPSVRLNHIPELLPSIKMDPNSVAQGRRHDERQLSKNDSTESSDKPELLKPARYQEEDNFLSRRAARKAGKPQERPQTYNSIAQTNPFSASPIMDTESGATLFPSPTRHQVPGLQPSSTAPNLKPTPPSRIDTSRGKPFNKRSSSLPFPPANQAQASTAVMSDLPLRMPQFMASTPTKDQPPRDAGGRTSPSSNGPASAQFGEVTGILCVHKTGRWMMWSRESDGTSAWHLTSVIAEPSSDPRILCPDLHDTVLMLTHHNADSASIIHHYNLMQSALNQSQRNDPTMSNMSPMTKRPSGRESGVTDQGSPRARGRQQHQLSPNRPILKSPERTRENGSQYRPSTESSRNVTFDLYPGRTNELVGAPAEMLFRPAVRPHQKARVDAMTTQVQQHHNTFQPPNAPGMRYATLAGAHGAQMPQAYNQDSLAAVYEREQRLQHEEANRQMYAAYVHAQQTQHLHGQQPAQHGWPNPILPEPGLPAGNQDKSSLGMLPPAMNPASGAQGGVSNGVQLPPATASTYVSTDPEKRSPGQSDVTASEKQRPLSTETDTDELLNAFPGRLGGKINVDAGKGQKNGGIRNEGQHPKLFGNQGLLYRGTKLDHPIPEEKKISPMQKFSAMASKLISQAKGKNNRDQPGNIVRRASEKLKRSPSGRNLANALGLKYSDSIADGDGEAIDNDDDDHLPKISVTPGDQMWILARVEFILVLTANQYLMTQKEAGRMSAESVAQIAQKWHKRNRPQVLEFMFDFAMQMELVRQNADNFMFHGPRAQDSMSRASMLNAWRNLARDLNNRTFCLPDHAIKKILVDGFRLLEMLGGDGDAFIEFRDMQRNVTTCAEDAARRAAQTKTAVENGVTRKVASPLMISVRGIVDDNDDYYEDGIFKG